MLTNFKDCSDHQFVKIYDISSPIAIPNWVNCVVVHRNGMIYGFENTNLFHDEHFWYVINDSRGYYHQAQQGRVIHLGTCEYNGDWQHSRVDIINV